MINDYLNEGTAKHYFIWHLQENLANMNKVFYADIYHGTVDAQ